MLIAGYTYDDALPREQFAEYVGVSVRHNVADFVHGLRKNGGILLIAVHAPRVHFETRPVGCVVYVIGGIWSGKFHDHLRLRCEADHQAHPDTERHHEGDGLDAHVSRYAEMVDDRFCGSGGDVYIECVASTVSHRQTR